MSPDTGSAACSELCIPSLELVRYRLEFEAAEPIKSSGFRGSAWRGLLGHALKRLVCITRDSTCDGCLLRQSCAYPYMFETPTFETGFLRRTTAAPHPFVLDIAAYPQPGRTRETVGLAVIGKGNRYAAYMLHALAEAGARGLRPEAVPLRLAALFQETHPGAGDWTSILTPEGLRPAPAATLAIPPAPPAAEIRFITPLRVKRDQDLVTPAAFRFRDLAQALLRRISLLAEYHGPGPWALEFPAWFKRSEAVEFAQLDVGWKEWTRRSQRQGVTMQMGGLVGVAHLAGDAWRAFWPALYAGSFFHAGKNTAFGLGQYSLRRIEA